MKELLHVWLLSQWEAPPDPQGTAGHRSQLGHLLPRPNTLEPYPSAGSMDITQHTWIPGQGTATGRALAVLPRRTLPASSTAVCRYSVPVLRLAKQLGTSSSCGLLPPPTSAQQHSSFSFCSVLLAHVSAFNCKIHAVFQRLNTNHL